MAKHPEPYSVIVAIAPEARPAVSARFWRHVRRGTTPDGCYLWVGPTNQRTQRGQASPRYYCHDLRGAIHAPAARVAWMLAFGSVPLVARVVRRAGCGPTCVRPSHHELVVPLRKRSEGRKLKVAA